MITDGSIDAVSLGTDIAGKDADAATDVCIYSISNIKKTP